MEWIEQKNWGVLCPFYQKKSFQYVIFIYQNVLYVCNIGFMQPKDKKRARGQKFRISVRQGAVAYSSTYAVCDPSRGIICRNTVGSSNHAFQLRIIAKKHEFFNFQRFCIKNQSIHLRQVTLMQKQFYAVNTGPNLFSHIQRA